MVIDDLSSLPVSPLIVAEGSILPASAVSSGIAERSRSMWLLPTTPFFETHLPSPDSGEGPRELYRLLRKTIEQEVEEHDVPSLKADGTLLEAEMVTVLAGYFRDALTEGPTASSTEDRQQLLREMNEAIVAQVEGYYARPWAKGNPDVVECAFVCECGRPECDADMVLAMGEVATGRPVLVPGHSGQT
jgi:hypothetical protein